LLDCNKSKIDISDRIKVIKDIKLLYWICSIKVVFCQSYKKGIKEYNIRDKALFEAKKCGRASIVLIGSP
jgi:hypothetical protein